MGSEIEGKVINSFLEKNNLAFAWFPVKSENFWPEMSNLFRIKIPLTGE